MRIDGRANDSLRQINITRNFTKHAQGSVLIEVGDTRVICTAMIEDKVPPFLKGLGEGWITCEYNMIPSSTNVRKTRDISKLKIDGRTMEIQRLIGRSLRSVVDLKELGERTIWIDCDVIEADGGTRTASINGAFVALVDAVNKINETQKFNVYPVKNFVSAVSVGIVDNNPMLDLCYDEDSNAMVDMNIVMTNSGEYIELQGTGEKNPFGKKSLVELLNLGEKGAMEIINIQKNILGSDGSLIGNPL